MRTQTLILFFAFGLIISGCQKELKEDNSTEGTFTALTYNVAGLPEPASSSHPIANTPQISPRLNNYDIVNVQEDFAYHDLLIKDDKHAYRSQYVANRGYGDGLNLFSKYIITNFMRTEWTDCNGFDCFTPKGFTLCRLKLSSKIYVDLYNVHCNAGSDSADLIARRKNILQLAKFIAYRSKGNAVIIMGDMNCRYTRTGDNIREILNLGFKDAWIETQRNGVLPLQDGISLMDCDPIATNPTCEVVDKIFFRSSDKIKIDLLDYRVEGDAFLDANGEWLSDHRPLFAKFHYQLIP
ncbi:MAG TPA: endonuclease/exonuclease/phosphatase family protein [Chitinophagales bacterium]|nr:endonuclease/exonuclease/phosphatase family protein [Chitinophagales bacterium]